MTETLEVSLNQCTFRTDAEAIEMFAAPAGEAEGKQRFKITGYSGSMVPKHPKWGDLVIDLDGIKVGKQRSPILLDHEAGNRVGFAESVKVDHATGLVVNGSFLKSTPSAKQVLEEMREGYPWQASISVQPLAIERMERGAKARINGRDFEFPDGGTVFRRTNYRETSLVALGADEQTDAQALSLTEKVSVSVLNAPTEKSMEPKKEEASSPPPLTRDRLKAEHPEVYATVFADGIAAERSRVTEIFNAAPDVARDIALKVVKDGASVVEALKLFLEDGRRLKTEKLAAINGAADKPVGGGKEVETKTYATPEEKYRAEFAAMSHAMQAEFGDADTYVGFQQCKAKGAYKLYTANTAPKADAEKGEAL